MKIYRSFELRFGVKLELESVRIKAGIRDQGSKLESSRGSEGREVGTSDRVCQLLVKRRIREQGNKGTREQGEESKTKRKKKEKNR